MTILAWRSDRRPQLVGAHVGASQTFEDLRKCGNHRKLAVQ